ncbi:hypothetical protein HMH01_00050 [Halovulum dunhuangense]|uniref:Peptidoglycan binding-like domain-containing protein n=1 Tax=Halovulum dunhuangense TaxID=1505036 RepID=A0A849KZ94_9RHOB|nr:peptidoglycan-binding protein [Halovulum dunhuangense]NNU78814.1 hypothetical protein [Halovulum dunhuangense]
MTPRRTALTSMLALALGAGPLWAADMALVLTESGALLGAEPAHDARVRAYRDAGYDITEGFDLDRADLARLLEDFEAELEDADRLVIHLTGRMEQAGGVPVLLPREAEGESSTALLTSGVPLGLFLDFATQSPGQSFLALGRAAAPDAPGLTLSVPDGVVVMRGAPDTVSGLVTGAMIGAGLPPTAIDATAAGVVFEGDLSADLRLGRTGSTPAAPAPTPSPEPEPATPEAMEAALGLSVEQRREIQRNLTALGQNTRGIDGIFGPGTRAAIRAWEEEAGREADGYLTRREIDQLARDADAARAEQAARERADRDAWATAQGTDSVEAYRRYLDRYPRGIFARRAEERIAVLEAERADRQDWARAQDADTIAGYRRYLDAHPDGLFVERARERIVALGGDVESPRERADRETWAAAQSQDTIAAYSDYLDRYPRGMFAERAENRIEALRDASREEERAVERAREEERRQGLNIASILLIEARLALLGFNPGTVDGRIDDTARGAIRSFQDRNGLTVSGYLDNDTMQRLVGGR